MAARKARRASAKLGGKRINGFTPADSRKQVSDAQSRRRLCIGEGGLDAQPVSAERVAVAKCWATEMRISPEDIFIPAEPDWVMSLLAHWEWCLDPFPKQIVAVTALGDVFYHTDDHIRFPDTSGCTTGSSFVADTVVEFESARTSEKFAEDYLRVAAEAGAKSASATGAPRMKDSFSAVPESCPPLNKAARPLSELGSGFSAKVALSPRMTRRPLAAGKHTRQIAIAAETL